MNIMTGDGISLYVERKGGGIPCIYLHGGPGYWSKTFQHFSGKYLEENMEMIYLDQRGCGRSAYDDKLNYSLNRLVDDIEEVREQLGIDEWYVMGHSFGGILAVNYAYKYRLRTRGIILTNATLNMIDSFSHQIKKGREILNEKPIDIPTDDLPSFMTVFYSTLEKLINSGKYFNLQFKNLGNKTEMDKLDKYLDTDPSFQQFIFSAEEYFQDFTRITDKINVPVLVITGRYDDAIGPAHHQTFKFYNSMVNVLNSKHHPYMEDPLAFNKAIAAFINQ
ncbi:alpha/beta fold hydrolase [Virgibacillus oceani]|uniref:Proline iminopeptidase n=1 Tax=Virgibacillus oceani TaxID=1479511 RepID=A0A917HLH2_9BACI|nr:alpha/beta hydrolase [Virgibacillus oceani]GGG83537.1 proline iminopeptidase [Virgibacillus oceani]